MKSLLIALMLFASGLSAQRIDPDWCLTCSDSRQHFIAGAGIDIAALVVLSKSKPWQRVLITTTISAAYEFGQESASRNAEKFGPGYGFGPKDLILGIFGSLVVEGVYQIVKED